MNKIKLKPSIIIIISYLCILIGLFPRTALAETPQVTIDIHPKEIHQGEVFTINLTFTSSSNPIGSLNASLSYDEDKIEYQSDGSNAVQISGGTGLIVDTGSPSTREMIYSLQFLAKTEGTAAFAVTKSEVIAFDTGMLLESPQKSISVPIQPDNNNDLDGTIEVYIPYISLDVDQEYTMLPLDITPDGYHPTNIVIAGTAVPVLQPDDFKGFYLVKAINKQGDRGYYFYDNTEGTMQRVWLTHSQKEDKQINWTITALAVFCLILLVLIILLSYSYRPSNRRGFQ